MNCSKKKFPKDIELPSGRGGLLPLLAVVVTDFGRLLLQPLWLLFFVLSVVSLFLCVLPRHFGKTTTKNLAGKKSKAFYHAWHPWKYEELRGWKLDMNWVASLASNTYFREVLEKMVRWRLWKYVSDFLDYFRLPYGEVYRNTDFFEQIEFKIKFFTLFA